MQSTSTLITGIYLKTGRKEKKKIAMHTLYRQLESRNVVQMMEVLKTAHVYNIVMRKFFSFSDIARYYFSCSRDGLYRENKWNERKTEKKHMKENKKSSRKLGDHRCLSRLYVSVVSNGSVEVEYLPVHTNHSLMIREEAKHLPLPQSVKDCVSQKLLAGVPIPRVLQGSCIHKCSIYG